RRRYRSGGFETGDLGNVHSSGSGRGDSNFQILDLRPRPAAAAEKTRPRRFYHEPNAHRRLQALSLARSLSDVQQVQRGKKTENCRQMEPRAEPVVSLEVR